MGKASLDSHRTSTDAQLNMSNNGNSKGSFFICPVIKQDQRFDSLSSPLNLPLELPLLLIFISVHGFTSGACMTAGSIVIQLLYLLTTFKEMRCSLIRLS